MKNEVRLLKKQNQSYREQIDNLNSDIQQLEMTISMYKNEHLRLMETNNSSQDEQTNLLRKLTEEKVRLRYPSDGILIRAPMFRFWESKYQFEPIGS